MKTTSWKIERPTEKINEYYNNDKDKNKNVKNEKNKKYFKRIFNSLYNFLSFFFSYSKLIKKVAFLRSFSSLKSFYEKKQHLSSLTSFIWRLN